MSIANELSTDVAAAVLARHEEKVHASPKELIELVVRVHSVLRELTSKARRGNRRPGRLSSLYASGGAASSRTT